MTSANSNIPRVVAAYGASEALAALREHGAVVIRNATQVGEVRAIAFELEPYLRRTPFGEGAFYGLSTRRTNALVRKSTTAVSWAMNRLVLELVDGVLGANCDCVQLNAAQAIRIEPGETDQFLHRDDELFPVTQHAPQGFELMINFMWAIDPFTHDNGATRIVPGSHRWSRDREARPEEAVAAEMDPGDMLVFLGSTVHGGGGNTTDTNRTGVVLSYSLGWLRQLENFALSVPWEFAQHLPEKVQRLLGYQIHRPSLGYVEGVDPIDWLRAGQPAVSAARDMFTEEQLAMVAANSRVQATQESVIDR